MKAAVIAAAAAALLVTGCSKNDDTDSEARKASLQEYVASAKGKADAAKARAKAEARRPAGIQGTRDNVAMAWSMAEGTWNGELPGGGRIQVAISRDGGGSIQMQDAEGRSLANAMTTVALAGAGVRGTTTSPPQKLAQWEHWTMTRRGSGLVLQNPGRDSVLMVRAAS